MSATAFVDAQTGSIYSGQCKPGDREATAEEFAAWQSSRVTLEVVRAECQRRIDVAVSLNQKLNMLGTTAANVQAVAILGQPATDEHKQTASLFIQAMQWIGSMRAACPALVGNINFATDDPWPALTPELEAFAAQF